MQFVGSCTPYIRARGVQLPRNINDPYPSAYLIVRDQRFHSFGESFLQQLKTFLGWNSVDLNGISKPDRPVLLRLTRRPLGESFPIRIACLGKNDTFLSENQENGGTGPMAALAAIDRRWALNIDREKGVIILSNISPGHSSSREIDKLAFTMLKSLQADTVSLHTSVNQQIIRN